MTADGWRLIVLGAAYSNNENDDPAKLDLLASLLAQQDEAKERLRELGYGCIGSTWSDVVREIETEERFQR